MLHSVSPISLSATYLNLFCPVPLSLLGDRLFVRFWVIFMSILIEVGYSRFPNAPETHPGILGRHMLAPQGPGIPADNRNK